MIGGTMDIRGWEDGSFLVGLLAGGDTSVTNCKTSSGGGMATKAGKRVLGGRKRLEM